MSKVPQFRIPDSILRRLLIGVVICIPFVATPHDDVKKRNQAKARAASHPKVTAKGSNRP